MCLADSEDDESLRHLKRKKKALLDVKREITYTVYSENLENTVRLLTNSKAAKLMEDRTK